MVYKCGVVMYASVVLCTRVVLCASVVLCTGVVLYTSVMLCTSVVCKCCVVYKWCVVCKCCVQVWCCVVCKYCVVYQCCDNGKTLINISHRMYVKPLLKKYMIQFLHNAMALQLSLLSPSCMVSCTHG